MQFEVKSRFLRFSPYKLRPIVDVVRGKPVAFALNWLETYKVKRAEPIKKAIESAVANARNVANIEPASLSIKEIHVDEGPTHKYFKPGAMGRANVQRKRLSHLRVVLEDKNEKK